MTHLVSRCIGMMTARAATGLAGSAYYRYSHSNPTYDVNHVKAIEE